MKPLSALAFLGTVVVAAVVVSAAAPVPASGQSDRTRQSANAPASASDRDWCDDAGDDRDSETFCEVRELTGAKPTVLDVTNQPNGSIRVVASTRRDVLVRARVTARARTEAAARDIGRDVRVSFEGGRVRATGPDVGRRESWSVSYRIDVPATIDMNLETSNGSIDVTGVTGRIRAESSNGSVRLADLGGDVRAVTSNGSLRIVLDGTTWSGSGLEATTSNGSVRVDMPSNYNAELVAGTSNGSIDIDVPVQVTGRISRRVETTLGKGGPTLRVQSSNGSLTIRRR